MRRLELEVLEDGHISGLNGVLLGAAAREQPARHLPARRDAAHLQPASLPQSLTGDPGSLCTITGIELDFAELAEQSKAMEEQLGELLAQSKKHTARNSLPLKKKATAPSRPRKNLPNPSIRGTSRRLFEEATKDRSKAFELKQELDRLGVFKEYEDRFLDLFKGTKEG